ncbi:MAG: T9SS type A sorting domain-containing protein [Ignavibacteria bacterium]
MKNIFLLFFLIFFGIQISAQIQQDTVNGYFPVAWNNEINTYETRRETDTVYQGISSQSIFISSQDQGSITLQKNFSTPKLRSNEFVLYNFTKKFIPTNLNTWIYFILEIGYNGNFDTVGTYEFSTLYLGFWDFLMIGVENPIMQTFNQVRITFNPYFSVPQGGTIEFHVFLDYFYSGYLGGGFLRMIDPFDWVPTDIIPIQGNVPEKFSLSQNYPNPFNPKTNINFQVPKTSLVTLKVYDVLGREVVALVNEKMQAGSYKVDFDGSRYTSGTYFYRLETDGYAETKKMLLIK